MNDPNPYQPSMGGAILPTIRKVKVRPFELFRRAQDLIGDQYWLFFGITAVGIVIGSAVPFGIVLGPMMVGIYLCFMDREQGKKVDFATLFRGFDQFADALVATLIMIALSFLVMVPVTILAMVIMFWSISANSASGSVGNAQPGLMFFLVFYPTILLVSFLIYVPFVFAYQLIADRKLTAIEAVKLSLRASFKNILGILLFLFVVMVISVMLALMCYVPAFFFMPISFGALFVPYRDVFPIDETPPIMAELMQ